MKTGLRNKRGLLAGLMAAVLLFAAATYPAAAVAGWEMFASSGKQALIEDIQKFIDNLKGDHVVNMQVSYAVPDGSSKIPNTLIDKSHYNSVAEEVRRVKLQAEPAAGSDSAGDFTLNITTLEETVALRPEGKNIRVSGSRGTAVFGASCSINDMISALPGVADVLASLSRDNSRTEIARLYQNQLDESGPLIGYNGKLNDIYKGNPSSLSVDYNTIDTVQIFDGDEYSVLVTGKNDRIRLCNLVNLTRPSSVMEQEKRVLRKYDGMRLEFRLRDGSKHEYRMDKNSDNLIVDGQKYSDARIARIFDAVLADAFFRYPTRVAWLGYMNARRIVSATILDGTGSVTYTATGSKSRISQLAAELKAIKASDCTPYRRGHLPAPVQNSTPVRTITLVFDGGAEYRISEYDPDYLTMDWVDQDLSYLYRKV